MSKDRIVVAGACPFLFCLEVDVHAHPICPECGALRFGNMFCERCVAERAKFEERGDRAVLVPLEGPLEPVEK